MTELESDKPNATHDKSTLVGSDILFECPKCGKSLIIDCQGAGLNIQCPQCQNELEVPIPNGFDISKLDKEIAAAAQFSSEGLEQIRKLQDEVKELRAEKQQFIQRHADLLNEVKKVTRQLEEFHKALNKLSQINVTSATEVQE